MIHKNCYWQPQYGDAVRSLPKPSPIHMTNTDLPKKKEGEEDGEEEEEVKVCIGAFLTKRSTVL